MAVRFQTATVVLLVCASIQALSLCPARGQPTMMDKSVSKKNCALMVSPRKERRAQHEFMDEVGRLLSEEKFDELEKLGARLRREKIELPVWRRKLRLYYLAMQRPPDKPTERDWHQLFDRHEVWIKAKPKSATALISQAEVHFEYGMFRRGPWDGWRGYSPAGVRAFHEELKAAEKLLRKAEDLALGDDPELYRTLIMVRRNLGGTREEIRDLLKKSIAVDPAYTPTITHCAVFLSPRHRGRPGDLEKFAAYAVKLTKDRCGNRMYGTIVWWTFQKYGAYIFEEFEFSWEQTKQAYEEQMKRHPKSAAVVNQYCLLASLAGDRETAWRLLDMLGPTYVGALVDHRVFSRTYDYTTWRTRAKPDIFEGDQRGIFLDNLGIGSSLTFSPDGKTMASISVDTSVRLWDVP